MRIRALVAGIVLLAMTVCQTARADWAYQESRSPMDGEVTNRACTTSDMRLDLKFPYAGGAASLCLVKRGQKATNVYVVLTKGQLLCHSFSPCTVRVKFDDRPPFSMTGVGTNDGRTNAAFLEPEKQFITALRRSKKVLIELTIYDNGVRVIDFDIDGLTANY
jgi:hypothetical protein